MGKPAFSSSSLLGTGLGFGGIGLALLTPESFPSFLAAYDAALRSTGFATSGIGGVLVAGALLKWVGAIAGDGYRRLSSLSPLAERFIDFDNAYALQSDLGEIYSLGKSVIGDNHADEDLLRNRITKCQHIIRKLLRSNDPNSPIHGYYITYPLTKTGMDRIDKKQVVNGKTLQDRDLSTGFHNAKAIYISMIFGDGWRAKAAALLHLKNDISHLRETNSKIRKFYAKPSTKDGLRLLKHYGFKPIDDETGIWVLSV